MFQPVQAAVGIPDGLIEYQDIRDIIFPYIGRYVRPQIAQIHDVSLVKMIHQKRNHAVGIGIFYNQKISGGIVCLHIGACCR